MILNYTIQVEIIPAKIDRIQEYEMSVDITPAPIPSQAITLDYPFEFNLSKIQVNVSEPIKSSAFQFLSEILETYVDEDRELKNLLNFGEDNQNVIVSYRYGPQDAIGNRTLQLKLLEPLSDEILSNEEGVPTEVFISREVANSVIQTVRFLDAPLIDRTPYLRPKNTGITINEEIGRSLKNITLNVLNLETGSLGTTDVSKNISFEDAIFRRWYSYDFNSSELNIDFTDYNNFVFYGSATMRLHAFKQKLLEIEKLTQNALQFEGSVFTGSLASAGATYIQEQSAKFSKEKEEIIRSFDRYEQHLYFTPAQTDSPYSASAWYAEGGEEYNQISYWPKINNNTLYPVNSEEAQIWFDTQLQIAQRFDEFNENNLINTIPTHIREDEENSSYFTFVTMIGHFFDTIKPYVDQFPYIYSRYTDPDKELSKDLVTEIAESIGFKLPTIDSIYTLSESVIGTSEKKPRQYFTVEAYKRLLHNISFFAKSKGTRTALRMVLSTLGITEQLVTIQESGVSDENSFRVLSEFYNSVKFTGDSSYIELPVSSSFREPYPRSIQLNLTVDQNKDMTVLSGDNLWKLDVKVNPENSNLIKFQLISSNNTILLSTKYFKNNPFELINVSLQTFNLNSLTKLRVIKTNQEDVVIDLQDIEQNNFVPLWNTTNNIYIGGSGSIATSNFIGTIDDARLWGINLTDNNTLNSAFDPGSNAGNIFTDASEHLYIQVSLNKINLDLLSQDNKLLNESLYKNKLSSPSLEFINTVGLTTGSFSRASRYIKQYLPNIGSTGYVTNKVKVAPPPIFVENKDLVGLKRLYRTESIVKLEDKKVPANLNKINIASSPAKLINQNIIRNIGLENINAAYGIPNDSYRNLPRTLENLRNYYNKFYFMKVDSNKFIKIVEPISSVIRQLSDYFIPARASIYSGVVIEPTLLERTKLPALAKIRVYGKGTRRTKNATNPNSPYPRDYAATFTLSQSLDITDENKLTPSVKSSALDAKTARTISTISALTINVDTVSQDVNGKFLQLNSQVESTETISSGNILPLKALVERRKTTTTGIFKLIDKQHLSWNIRAVLELFKKPLEPTFEDIEKLINKFPTRYLEKKSTIDLQLTRLNKFGFSLSGGRGKQGYEPYGRIYSRRLFEYEITRPRSGGQTSLTRRGLYSIPPSCDLNEFGARNFFGQPFGVYYFNKKLKRPIFTGELDAIWSIENQEFINVPTWSFNQRYNLNDVVLQDLKVNSEDANILGEEITNSALLGNGRYYVFKTSPATVSENYETIQEQEGESFYTETVPSTLPPSLDKANWARIKFAPFIVREPKRVVFDTFTILDPALNDFKTTTVDLNLQVDLPDRFVDKFEIGTIPVNSRKLGQIRVQNILALFATQINSLQTGSTNIRVRLYRSAESRDLDISRDLTTYPEPDDGVLLDMTINQLDMAQIINPIITLVSGDTSFSGDLYYTIDNLDTKIIARIELYLYYFALQNEPRLPRGYLKKHYRYFRDNSTPTKRRNFIGCKNTEVTTIDGLSPIEVFFGDDIDASVR